MRSLEELSQVGIQLGYEGSDLKDFVREQQALERDERAAVREAEQKRLNNEAEQKKLENEAEQKKLENEAERKKLMRQNRKR